MSRRRTLTLGLTTLGLAAALALAGCSRDGEGKTPAVAAERPPVAVDAVTAAPGELVDAIDVVGTLQPKFAADVKAEFTAVVDEVFVSEWVRVSKGTPLARLDTRDGETGVEAARAAVAQAEVGETRAERELERALKLKEVGLMTQQGLDDARSARDAAAATTAAARAQLGAAETYLTKAILRAPFDGIIAFRGVNPGDRVESMGGPVLFRIVDPRLLELVVTVPSVRLAALAVGERLEFSSDAFPGRTFTGEVKFINPEIDPATRSVKVVALVPNRTEELRGGLFVTGRILAGTRSGVLMLPRAALASWDVDKQTAEVFVLDGDRARQRSIQTGAVSGDTIEVRSGLSAGDRVVTRGGYNLKDGDRVKVGAEKA
jgi:membrane fusion protein (multidrug efflux system)